MYRYSPLPPIDYLVIGHITCDITPDGLRVGGTAAYSALMAQALGARVGVVTSWAGEVRVEALDSLPIANYPTDRSTTFENTYNGAGRRQIIQNVAPALGYNLVPEAWRSPAMVHLGPVAQEVEPGLVRNFPSAFLGITPQGWLRDWNGHGEVFSSEWPEASFVLQRAGATVISVEDVGGDEGRIEEMAASSRILAVTEADQGSRLYWNGDVRRFRAPRVNAVDATGAGDVYAAAFFIRLYNTRDPWEAARFATQLATISVSRPGLDGIPSVAEIQECMVEVF
jgi:sugar/nucleoside kinase (ribokinase family)